MMKRHILLFASAALAAAALAQQPVITATWNAKNVILPSSQYTPAETWEAQVMVFNDGKRYADADYNHVWGTPPQDADGRRWYEPDYQLTDGCSYDENPKVYLNGTLIWQTNGWNDNDYARYTLTNTQKQLLKEGDNVIAVSLMAGGGGGHIDLGLSITEPYVPTGIQSPVTTHHPPLTTLPSGTYDLQGRRIANSQTVRSSNSQIPHGLYIQNGKKVIK